MLNKQVKKINTSLLLLTQRNKAKPLLNSHESPILVCKKKKKTNHKQKHNKIKQKNPNQKPKPYWLHFVSCHCLLYHCALWFYCYEIHIHPLESASNFCFVCCKKDNVFLFPVAAAN